MKITRVRVQNYKSVIDSDWIDINQDTTTLIGKNESGKTSLLEAIAFFSTSESCDEENINNSVDTSTNDKIPIISIEIKVEDSDPEGYHQIINSTSSDTHISFVKYNEGYKEVNEDFDLSAMSWERGNLMINTKESVVELREYIVSELSDPQKFISQLPQTNGFNLNNLQGQRNEVRKSLHTFLNDIDAESEVEEEVKERSEAKLRELMSDLSTGRNETADIFRNLPKVIYYDELDLIDDEATVEHISSGEHRTIKKVLDYLEVDYAVDSDQNYEETNRQLQQAELSAGELISNAWKQKSIEISINLLPDEVLRILVRDTALLQSNEPENDYGNEQEIAIRRRPVKPSQRSRGFQWFLSFCLNLVADEAREDREKWILLDDPAVFLHPEGKQDCLDAMKRMSNTTQIMYSTHSPFLIDKSHPERIRIVEDKGNNIGTQITTNFQAAEGIALEPVRKALGIGLGDLPFVSTRKVLLEGISDYYIMTAVGYYFEKHRDDEILDVKDVTLIPVGGADKMITAGKWVASEDFSYALVLDNDEKGREIRERIETHHRDIQSGRVVLLYCRPEGLII